MKQLILALAASIAALGVAQAQSTDGAAGTTGVAPYASGFTPHAYVGLGAAIADDLDTGDYRGSPKVFGGYEFTPNWGVEGGYTKFHEKSGYNSNGSYVAGKYTVPLGERFSGFAKLGLQHSERTDWSRQTDRDNGLYGGLGLQYALDRNLAVTGEYERYGKDKTSGAKADVYTVGLKYGF
ncbi:MAG TPA: porin family protein [Telluria sp.]